MDARAARLPYSNETIEVKIRNREITIVIEIASRICDSEFNVTFPVFWVLEFADVEGVDTLFEVKFDISVEF